MSQAVPCKCHLRNYDCVPRGALGRNPFQCHLKHVACLHQGAPGKCELRHGVCMLQVVQVMRHLRRY
eukprot:6372361-Pyramimonas_sp.AAC.2